MSLSWIIFWGGPLFIVHCACSLFMWVCTVCILCYLRSHQQAVAQSKDLLRSVKSTGWSAAFHLWVDSCSLSLFSSMCFIWFMNDLSLFGQFDFCNDPKQSVWQNRDGGPKLNWEAEYKDRQDFSCSCVALTNIAGCVLWSLAVKCVKKNCNTTLSCGQLPTSYILFTTLKYFYVMFKVWF